MNLPKNVNFEPQFLFFVLQLNLFYQAFLCLCLLSILPSIILIITNTLMKVQCFYSFAINETENCLQWKLCYYGRKTLFESLVIKEAFRYY